MKKNLNILIILLIMSASVFAEDISVLTVNAWPGLDYRGLIFSGEYETDEVRNFRTEILEKEFRDLNPDIAVITGANPVSDFAELLSEPLGMSAGYRISRSGFRIGPVGLPLNLKEGGIILVDNEYPSEDIDYKNLNRGLSFKNFSAFSKNMHQIYCRKAVIDNTTVFIFAVEWRESIFADRETLSMLMNNYLSGELEAEAYADRIDDAVKGSETRLKQAEESLAFINNIAGENPVILMGSLNGLPGSPEINLLKDAGFTDVFESVGRGKGNTLDSERNPNIEKAGEDAVQGAYRTDYIMIRGDRLKAVSAKLVFNEAVYGVFPSNRFGVQATVRLTAAPSSR